MLSRRSSHRRSVSLATALLVTFAAGLTAPYTPVAHAQLAPSDLSALAASLPAATSTTPVPVGAVELSPAPPNLTQAVAPNIVVTFDDSGSMASNYMGDNRPFDGGSWTGPWRCAGVINPSITTSGDIRTVAMNGVYYNPNVLYTPPVRADGTSFPQADSSLAKVPEDGIAVNRTYNPVTLDSAAGYYNNPNGGSNFSRATNLAGQLVTTVTPGTVTTGSGNSCPGNADAGSCQCTETNKGNGKCKTYSWTVTSASTSTTTDRRWTCGYDGTSPLDGKTAGPDGNTYSNGGPYYYRYKSSAPTITVNSYGLPDTNGLSNLYKTSNWEVVEVKNENVTISGVSVNAWQNFANWYAYYRTRNLMTRTSLSRVFGALGNPGSDGSYGSTIRVAWQNINDGDYKLPTSAIIASLMDVTASSCDASANPKDTQQPGTAPTATPNCYRDAFFNWIFNVPASGSTPNRAATLRAGKFFQRGQGVANLRNPYFEPATSKTADGTELVCRQNFQMLVTDGYWNEGDPSLPSSYNNQVTSITLPDGTAYDATAAATRVFWDVVGGNYDSSLANIAFNYWATDLRPDLYKPAQGKIVNPYMPDSTTGVISGATADTEKYFNPANDPANWPHLVQYMVTLGVAGLLNYSDDVDCAKSTTNDLCLLRKGQANSSGSTGWPKPSNNARQAIDDTWHAAINSRGAFFNAANPQDLVDQLGDILTNIAARNAPAATSGLNSSVLVQGSLGFATGYSSTDWSGTLQAVYINADGTSGAQAWAATDWLDNKTKNPPANRNIFTAKTGATGGFGGGLAFKTFTQLDATEQALLAGTPASTGTADNGQNRLNYIRGDNAQETAGVMRQRTKLLGAIINSQAVYEAYPSSGYRNAWPTGSPEALAAAAGNTYEQFVSDYKSRTPLVFVGANDGMLHAFDASETLASGTVVPTANAGKEVFGYVPRGVYGNLGSLTAKTGFAFEPTVDATPVVRDVFFASNTTTPVSTTKGWHTVLVGGLRLGGRGVYALDVTDPDNMDASKVLWEFDADMPDQAAWSDGSYSNPGGKPSDLGYTFGQPNFARLADGRWVVLVPGGYFPDCSKADKPLNCNAYIPAASNKYSALFVLDAQTGKLIRELKTSDSVASGAVVSHGLSSPVLGDYNDDQLDDVAFAGDLDGNLWRFDLSDANPANWAVTLTYKPTVDNAQPITVMPRLFPDPVTNRFIVVFGTGKYIGASDNTSGSSATQSIYGIRDTGPIFTRSNLVAQTLVEATTDDGKNTARGITDNAVPAGKGGWYIDLNLASSPGERVVVTPGALFDSNRVVITTLIPGTNDPCNATIQGAVMVLDAGTGGSGGGLSQPSVSGWSGGSAYRVVGGRVDNPPTGGTLPIASQVGGGSLLVPGLSLTGGGSLDIDDAIWRRRSWRELNNL